MSLKVYLSGEIHTDWREQIIEGAKALPVSFSAPVTDHDASDDCGVAILGAEDNKYWHDHKGGMVIGGGDVEELSPVRKAIWCDIDHSHQLRAIQAQTGKGGAGLRQMIQLGQKVGLPLM